MYSKELEQAFQTYLDSEVRNTAAEIQRAAMRYPTGAGSFREIVEGKLRAMVTNIMEFTLPKMADDDGPAPGQGSPPAGAAAAPPDTTGEPAAPAQPPVPVDPAGSGEPPAPPEPPTPPLEDGS